MSAPQSSALAWLAWALCGDNQNNVNYAPARIGGAKVGNMISTQDAAKELGVSQRRIQALIKAKRLPAKQIGGTWIIDSDDLDKVRERKPGRPKS